MGSFGQQGSQKLEPLGGKPLAGTFVIRSAHGMSLVTGGPAGGDAERKEMWLLGPTYVCSFCEQTLIRGTSLGFFDECVFQCGACGEYSRTPPADEDAFPLFVNVGKLVVEPDEPEPEP